MLEPSGGRAVNYLANTFGDSDVIPYWGEYPDDQTHEQAARCALDADHFALMADHHLGYSVPIGGVFASKTHISPSAVGYDIGCGNKAIKLNTKARDIYDRMPEIMDAVFSQVAFGVGRTNETETVCWGMFDSPTWDHIPALKGLKDLARSQLGTVGSGNHYVDIFEDESDGNVWIGNHFGSRGLGHKTATWFLAAIGAEDKVHAVPKMIEVKSDLGMQYIDAMKLAGMYAGAGRSWVCERVRKIVGGDVIDEVHNHHNFAWLEEHAGQLLWVTRKGATPARPGQRGFVGGSMTESAVIISGRKDLTGPDLREAEMALYSTVHGAGRVLGRAQALGKKDKRTGEWKRQPLVTDVAMAQDVRQSGIELRGAGVDESSYCYKRLISVLAAHRSTIEVEAWLRPLGVAMAPKWERGAQTKG